MKRYRIVRRNATGPWILGVVAILGTAMLLTSIPSARRYLRLRSM